MDQLVKQEMTSRADGRSGLLAPDTSGLNFYRADPALTDLLRLYLPEALFAHIEPHLDRLGELAGGPLDECARLADRLLAEPGAKRRLWAALRQARRALAATWER